MQRGRPISKRADGLCRAQFIAKGVGGGAALQWMASPGGL